MGHALATEKVDATNRQHLAICWLEESESNAAETLELLEREGFAVSFTSDGEEALRRVGQGSCRVAVAEVQKPGAEGLAFLERALALDPGVNVILLSPEQSVEAAVEAIKKGACDYLTKPIDHNRLLRILDELSELAGRRRRVRELEDRLLEELEFHGIVGRSPAMLNVFELSRKVAPHYRNLLLAGPTGAGKELIARAIHRMSPVADRRFAACNCSALVDTLLESQLFGHVRGAFTGATDTRAGLFEYADGGTVFLDEVGETSAPTQAKLLRVIQNREIQKVGSPEVKRVDVRLLAATNRDLRAEVAAGRFREDLFYRLASLEITVPSLAERLEDIPLLVKFFLKKYNESYARNIQGLTRRAQNALLRHNWPGNVRELENVIASAVILATGDFIDLDGLPEQLHREAGGESRPAENGWRPLSLEEVRGSHIERVLELCRGNRVRAAQLLGIGRTSLYRHLKKADRSRKEVGGGSNRNSTRTPAGHKEAGRASGGQSHAS